MPRTAFHPATVAGHPTALGLRTSGEIADRFDSSWATISRHLSILKDARLILAERDGQFIRYELNMTVFQDAVDQLLDLVRPRRTNVFVLAVIAVMCVLHVGVVGSALGWPLPVGRLAPISIGALFVVLGNLLPRFRSNFFFGIRTPWTLSSDTVWTKTHRVGGYVMVLIGLLQVVAGTIGSPRWFLVAICGAIAMVTVVLVYSLCGLAS